MEWSGPLIQLSSQLPLVRVIEVFRFNLYMLIDDAPFAHWGYISSGLLYPLYAVIRAADDAAANHRQLPVLTRWNIIALQGSCVHGIERVHRGEDARSGRQNLMFK